MGIDGLFKRGDYTSILSLITFRKAVQEPPVSKKSEKFGQGKPAVQATVIGATMNTLV